MRATPFKVQSDIAVRLNRQRDPGLDAHSQRRSQTTENDSLFRLIRGAAQPDQLIGFDQNGDDDADESQASGEVEPNDAEPAGLTKPSGSGNRRANRKQQRDDRGCQRDRRYQIPDGEGREQRRQKDAGHQLLADRRGRPVGGSVNLAALQEGHRILIREL